MYEVNGIDLTGSQYRELRCLVALPDDESRAEFSKRALQPYDDPTLWNPNGVDCYKELESKGLIRGGRAMGAFLFHGEVTQAGVDFVRDYAEKERADRSRIWSDRGFQIGLSLVTLVLSALMGWVAGHIG